MIRTGYIHDQLVTQLHKVPYFDHLQVEYDQRGDYYKFTIYYDLAPDLKIAGADKTMVRLDYQIACETMDDNLDNDPLGHLGRVFWMQTSNDLAFAIMHIGPLKLDVTGEILPEIWATIVGQVESITAWDSYADHKAGRETGANEMYYIDGVEHVIQHIGIDHDHIKAAK